MDVVVVILLVAVEVVMLFREQEELSVMVFPM
jgi:hypothetical protein